MSVTDPDPLNNYEVIHKSLHVLSAPMSCTLGWNSSLLRKENLYNLYTSIEGYQEGDKQLNT